MENKVIRVTVLPLSQYRLEHLNESSVYIVLIRLFDSQTKLRMAFSCIPPSYLPDSQSFNLVCARLAATHYSRVGVTGAKSRRAAGARGNNRCGRTVRCPAASQPTSRAASCTQSESPPAFRDVRLPQT